jgi:hypothetical protein
MVDFFLKKENPNAKRIVADIILKELGSDNAKMIIKKLKRVQQKHNRSTRIASSQQIEEKACRDKKPGKHEKKNQKRKEKRIEKRNEFIKM